MTTYNLDSVALPNHHDWGLYKDQFEALLDHVESRAVWVRDLVAVAPASIARIGNDNVALLDASTAEACGRSVVPPDSWETCDVYAWVGPYVAAGGDAVLTLQHSVLTDGMVFDTVGGTLAPAVVVTLDATAHKMKRVLVAADVPCPTTGPYLTLRLGRSGANVADTLAADLTALALELVRKT